MKMDLLSWTSSNPTCKLKLTSKQYYQRFLYRIKIYAPFGRVLRHTYRDSPSEPLWNQIAADVDARKERVRAQILQHFSSYWSERLIRHSDDCFEDQLEYLYRVFQVSKHKIKLRIEEPYVEIYAEDEQTVLDIVSKMPKRDTRVMEIHWPGHRLEALQRGEIFMPKIVDYEYQVNFRTVLLSTAKRSQIHDYLASLGDVVKMTPGLVDSLTRPRWAHNDHMWIYQSYFYTNDPSICTFLNLIDPHLIGKILKIARDDY